ncbi:MAG: GNAT family N-acetyltransferase [Acidobacteria bacterium]|nr:GNAT family N-acetyltransferase [Acidobacteriota bacterium]
MTIRPLHAIDEFRQVLELEKAIWGYEDAGDAVGIPVFVITVKRGGILLGAFDGGRMIGFVYSLVGLKHGRPMQWSHMLGVVPEHRASGIGRVLKLEQRRLALDMGLDLMEWTYDPLVAVNAHLNFRRLGVVVEDYVLNAYGDSSSSLHKGTPTDRFIAQWWMRTPRVETIVSAPAADPAPLPDAPPVNRVIDDGTWLACAGVDVTREDPVVVMSIPAGFNDMLEREPALGDEWRMASREVFGHYLARGYRVVDFSFGPGAREGRYLLSSVPEARRA